MIQGLKCHPEGIKGYGNIDHKVMIIGLSPGYNEVYTGQPLTGPSGVLLNTILKGSNFPREKVFCTNLVCTKNENPSPAQILACAKRLEDEIRLYKPKLIITLGAVVQNFFLPKYTIGKIRGCPTWSEKYNCYILPTYHPASVLHGTLAFIHDIARDLNKINDILEWPEKVALSEIEFSIATSNAQAQEAIYKYQKSEFFAVDVETTIGKDENGDIDVYNDSLITVCVGDDNSAVVIPVEFAQGLDWPCANYTFHNGMFDVQAIRRFLNITLEIKHDTLLMNYCLDERSGIHKLKQIAREYLGVGFYEEEVNNKKLDKTDFNKLAEYNAKDTVYTARLAKLLLNKMQIEDVLNPYYNILIPAANMFADVQYNGITISQDKINELTYDWANKYLKEEELLRKLAQENGWPDENINLNSPKQLSKLIYNIMGIPGGPSTAKSVLSELALINPFIARLICLRHIDHLFSTYILGTKDDIKYDSKVHANVLLHGTTSGRLSYTNPPMQTLPKNSNPDDPVEEAFENYYEVIKKDYPDYNLLEGLGRVREIFVPSDSDHIIIEADYGKAELYAAVVYSHDENLYNDLKSGDYHTIASKTYFKTENPTSFQRKNSKYVTFGRLYNRGAYAIAQAELKGWDLQEVESLVQGFDKRYFTYKSWAKETMKEAESTGVLTSLTGRKRRFLLMMGDEKINLLNSALNFKIQNLASDITLKAAIILHKKFKELELDCRILLLVHDAIYFEFHKKDLQAGLKLVKEIMTKPMFDNCIPTEVEFKLGTSFGNCKEIHA